MVGSEHGEEGEQEFPHDGDNSLEPSFAVPKQALIKASKIMGRDAGRLPE